MTIYLVILNILAFVGIVSIIYIHSKIKEERKAKRKEKFEKDVYEVLLKVLDKIEEDKK